MALACRADRANGREMSAIGHELKKRGLPLAARNRHGNQRVDEIAQAAKHIVRCRSQHDANVIRRQHECGDRKQVAHKRERVVTTAIAVVRLRFFINSSARAQSNLRRS